MTVGALCPGCGEVYYGSCPCRSTRLEQRRSVYDHPRWRTYTRPIVIERDRVCRSCGAAASTVDHVLPIETLLALGLDPFDPAECQLLCASCSGRKDGRRTGAARSPIVR